MAPVPNELIIELRNVFRERFSLSDLSDLCQELGIDIEALPGTSRNDKARELAAYLGRRDLVGKLAVVGPASWPDVPWLQIIGRYGLQTISVNDIQELVPILASFIGWQTAEDRKTLLTITRVISFINTNLVGAPKRVASRVIVELNNFGRTPEGDLALGRLINYLLLDNALPPRHRDVLEAMVARYDLQRSSVDDIQELVPILADYFGWMTAEGWKTFLINSGVIPFINTSLDGSPKEVASRVIVELNNFGRTAVGDMALERLIRYLLLDDALSPRYREVLAAMVARFGLHVADIKNLARILTKNPDIATAHSRLAFTMIAGIDSFVDVDLEGDSRTFASNLIDELNSLDWSTDGRVVVGRLIGYLSSDETLSPSDRRTLDDITARHGLKQ